MTKRTVGDVTSWEYNVEKKQIARQRVEAPKRKRKQVKTELEYDSDFVEEEEEKPPAKKKVKNEPKKESSKKRKKLIAEEEKEEEDEESETEVTKNKRTKVRSKEQEDTVKAVKFENRQEEVSLQQCFGNPLSGGYLCTSQIGLPENETMAKANILQERGDRVCIFLFIIMFNFFLICF